MTIWVGLAILGFVLAGWVWALWPLIRGRRITLWDDDETGE